KRSRLRARHPAAPMTRPVDSHPTVPDRRAGGGALFEVARSGVPDDACKYICAVRALTPFLMFCGDQHGKAEEAIRWYCSIFDDSRVVSIDHYGPGDAEPEGTV